MYSHVIRLIFKIISCATQTVLLVADPRTDPEHGDIVWLEMPQVPPGSGGW